MNVNATDTVINSGYISSDTSSSGNAGTVNVNSTNTLALVNNGKISSNTSGTGIAGSVAVNSNNLYIASNSKISSETSSLGDAGSVTVNAIETHLDGGYISSDTSSSGDAGTVTVNNQNHLQLDNSASISSNTSGLGSAGTVNVNSGTIAIENNSKIASASISTNSSGETGNVNVWANDWLHLRNNGQINIENEAFAFNPDDIIPGTINVTAYDIDMLDSSITTNSSGNVSAGDINVTFAHWLTMDPSFISTTANTGHGGDINIIGGELIYLQDSGFITSVSGADSNGGNISVKADYLIMDTGIIQANAIGGVGGDIYLDLKALIASGNNLIIGGSKVDWSPFSGLNVIQAASDSGLSGTISITAPEVDISGSVSELDTAALIKPQVDNDPCRSAAVSSSSLASSGKGGVPVNENSGFIPPVSLANNTVDKDGASININSTATAPNNNLQGSNSTCTASASL